MDVPDSFSLSLCLIFSATNLAASASFALLRADESVSESKL